MLWVKAFHILFVITWFACLFYLPRLFVYHADAHDSISDNRFKIMERKLYYFIGTPSAVLTGIFGFWMISFNYSYYSHQWWMHIKGICVILLYLYHIYCGYLVNRFKHNRNPFNSRFYRFFNEVPSLLCIVIIIMVVVQP